MTDLLEGVDDLVTTLKTIECQYKDETISLAERVVTRLGDVQPPCIWVAVESIDHTSSPDELLLRLFLVSGDVDEYRAIGTLSPMLDAVRAVVSPIEATTVVELNITTQQRGLPALRFTTSLI